MLNIGSHISSAKGYEAMGKQAQKLGASTFAFFTRNPRGGSAKEIRPEDVARFREMWKEYGDRVIVAHAPYTLNACSDKEEVRRFARETFASDLERMEYTPGNYYNFHPGSHVGQGAEEGIRQIAQMLNGCLKEEQSTTVLLETMAGKGSEIGRSFEELRAILDRVELSAKMGICLDTCHVWDAGYDIVNRLDEVLEAFDAVIGLERLKAVHINDSMNPCGSRKDRHARIGEGTIGLEAFGRIVRHPGLRDLPFILETPNDDAGWAEEIRLLRSLSG
ncbi:MAG: deoxyribonuclease IV [Lachnospiraceae bacterium]|nr:deoxyribonuclease IV [Lachnospiraceae bacterium]